MGGDLETRRRFRGSLVPGSKILLLRLKGDPEAYSLLARVAKSRHVSKLAVLGGGRGSGEVVLARQLAMYLMHVLLGRQQIDVARLMGRSRSTVTYACHAIETLRDHDDLIDGDIARIEQQGWGAAGETAAELRRAA